ncbi:MAG TPA: hypothetical protein VGK01_14955 [Candidatus Angelobacter sp.]|jgi:hypothetical protein
MQPDSGLFYEFHKERIVSRPGQPLITMAGIEIGPTIGRENAIRRLRMGKDVYTRTKEDAYRLAMSVLHGRILPEGPHDPKKPSPTGREDVYYRHYHPGNVHPEQGGPGHVFFGERGENFQQGN